MAYIFLFSISLGCLNPSLSSAVLVLPYILYMSSSRAISDVLADSLPASVQSADLDNVAMKLLCINAKSQ